MRFLKHYIKIVAMLAISSTVSTLAIGMYLWGLGPENPLFNSFWLPALAELLVVSAVLAWVTYKKT